MYLMESQRRFRGRSSCGVRGRRRKNCDTSSRCSRTSILQRCSPGRKATDGIQRSVHDLKLGEKYGAKADLHLTSAMRQVHNTCDVHHEVATTSLLEVWI